MIEKENGVADLSDTDNRDVERFAEDASTPKRETDDFNDGDKNGVAGLGENTSAPRTSGVDPRPDMEITANLPDFGDDKFNKMAAQLVAMLVETSARGMSETRQLQSELKQAFSSVMVSVGEGAEGDVMLPVGGSGGATITPPADAASPMGGAPYVFDLVQILYTAGDHILKYRTRGLTVDAGGNLTYANWGSYTTIFTAEVFVP